jgi:hypothetical protein
MVGVRVDVTLIAHVIYCWVTYCALLMYNEFRGLWKEGAVAYLTLSKPRGKREVFFLFLHFQNNKLLNIYSFQRPDSFF